MSTTTTSSTPAPVPTAEQHFNLRSFLGILLHLAPAIAAPFIPAGLGVQIFNAEAPIAEAVADALDGTAPTEPPA